MPKQKDKLKVAWLGHADSRFSDGTITYSQEITAGLRRRDIEVLFFHHAPDLQGPDSIPLDCYIRGRRVTIARYDARRNLRDLFRQHHIDLVHASLAFSTIDFQLPSICQELGLPLVGTWHAPFDHRFSLWSTLSQGVYRLYAPTLNRFDALIVLGKSQHQTLLTRGVNPEILRIIPNGVDTEFFSPGPSKFPKDHNLTRYFVYVGRIDKEKNVDILLQAFLNSHPPQSLKFVIVGEGQERHHLEQRYQGNPQIFFTGLVKDKLQVVDILRGATAFFLVSTIEGLSLSMLEAMSTGVATVATDVGDDGPALQGAGIVLDPSNLSFELNRSLNQLAKDPRLAKNLGLAARQRVLEKFSLEKNIDQVVDIYHELAERR